MVELRVTQVRSGDHAKPKTRGTLRALGLRGIGQTNTLPDRPEIRGMIARVPHLIKVETIESDGTSAGNTSGAKPADRTES
jgi:large subunit ribosomal protein L30